MQRCDSEDFLVFSSLPPSTPTQPVRSRGSARTRRRPNSPFAPLGKLYGPLRPSTGKFTERKLFINLASPRNKPKSSQGMQRVKSANLFEQSRLTNRVEQDNPGPSGIPGTELRSQRSTKVGLNLPFKGMLTDLDSIANSVAKRFKKAVAANYISYYEKVVGEAMSKTKREAQHYNSILKESVQRVEQRIEKLQLSHLRLQEDLAQLKVEMGSQEERQRALERQMYEVQNQLVKTIGNQFQNGIKIKRIEKDILLQDELTQQAKASKQDKREEVGIRIYGPRLNDDHSGSIQVVKTQAACAPISFHFISSDSIRRELSRLREWHIAVDGEGFVDTVTPGLVPACHWEDIENHRQMASLKQVRPSSSIQSLNYVLANAERFQLERLLQPLDPQNGLLCIWLFKNSLWKLYYTDSKYPVFESQDLLRFDPRQLWPLVLFKSLVIYFKGLPQLIAATVPEVVHAVTGMPCFQTLVLDGRRLWAKARQCLGQQGVTFCTGLGNCVQLDSTVSDGRTEYFRLLRQGEYKLLRSREFLLDFNRLMSFRLRPQSLFEQFQYAVDSGRLLAFRLQAPRPLSVMIEVWAECELQTSLAMRDGDTYKLKSLRKARARTKTAQLQFQLCDEMLLLVSVESRELADFLQSKQQRRTIVLGGQSEPRPTREVHICFLSQAKLLIQRSRQGSLVLTNQCC